MLNLNVTVQHSAVIHCFLYSRSQEERDTLLQGTGIPEAVNTDLDKILKEYSDVVYPLINKYPEFWPPCKMSLDLYKDLVAFVMAYRFEH